MHQKQRDLRFSLRAAGYASTLIEAKRAISVMICFYLALLFFFVCQESFSNVCFFLRFRVGADVCGLFVVE